MRLKFISNIDKTKFCIQFTNYWTNEVLNSYTFEQSEFKELFRSMKSINDEIAPKRKNYSKFRRLRKIND